MKAALYIRVSTDEQAKEGYSIPAQRERLLAYAHSQGWAISDEYVDEGRSGKDIQRPQLQRLLTDLPSNKFDVVLVYRLDRLTRSVLDLYSLLQEFDAFQVTFKSATEVYDTTTAMGRLFITLVAALAQWERENLGERTRLGKEQKVKQGKRAGGRPPFGYQLEQGNLVVHHAEAEIVRLIFHLYLTCQNMNTVADKLFEQGIVTRSKKPFSVKTIRDLLRNPVYSGLLRYNYTRKQQVSGASQTHKLVIAPPEEWIEVPAALPAIITPSEFDSVQQLLITQSRKKPRHISSTYLFSGLVICPNCNHTLLGKTSNQRKYYHCSYTKPGACHRFSMREDALEDLFVQKLHSLLQHVTVRIHLTGQESIWSEPVDTSIERELHQLQQKKQRLHDLYLGAFIHLEELSIQQQMIENRENELRQIIQEREQTVGSSLPTTDELAQALVDLPNVWMKLNELEKKKIVHILVERIHVSKDCSKKNECSITSIWFRQ
ncbi:recombinase family protein [Brevibacillus sp. SYSU BS000544]|uniref:recombinase family protein n=1 Tax=Brevibacillus sp. SYSU BS000544 TaxID=3416443 RepID=UPI003CE53ACD